MCKKILINFSLIVFSFFIAFASIFLGLSPVQSAQMSSVPNEDKSMRIYLDESNEGIDGSKTIVAPDLGDDQAFPFIPGFGKNSGKD